MKTLSSCLFWLGILSIPISLSFWFMDPILDYAKLTAISDDTLRDAFNLASSQRLAIFVGLWPPTLFILSYIIDQKVAMQESVSRMMDSEKMKTTEKEKISQNKKVKEREPVEVF